jgi:hypothetical protein
MTSPGSTKYCVLVYKPVESVPDSYEYGVVIREFTPT